VSGTPSLRALAPAKINLGLFLGPRRESDGRHLLATVMQSVSLADELTLTPASFAAGGDEIVCPGVPGAPEENLVARALRAFRARSGWHAPPVRITVHKRIPLAGGLGGGSADAAATLRLARAASGAGDERLLLEIAGELGADVPAQVSPGRWLAGGAGELLEALPAPRQSFAVLIVPGGFELSTADVYAEADRLGLARGAGEVHELEAELRAALGGGAALPGAVELLHNDLQRAAVSLRPELATTLRALAAAGAAPALLSGSGPTVLGLFGAPARRARAAAGAAAATIAASQLPALCAAPVRAGFGAPEPLGSGGA
jgi:4-diphosphocytidyl-2-C-methyl-D-erythritol kinase